MGYPQANYTENGFDFVNFLGQSPFTPIPIPNNNSGPSGGLEYAIGSARHAGELDEDWIACHWTADVPIDTEPSGITGVEIRGSTSTQNLLLGAKIVARMGGSEFDVAEGFVTIFAPATNQDVVITIDGSGVGNSDGANAVVPNTGVEFFLQVYMVNPPLTATAELKAYSVRVGSKVIDCDTVTAAGGQPIKPATVGPPAEDAHEFCSEIDPPTGVKFIKTLNSAESPIVPSDISNYSAPNESCGGTIQYGYNYGPCAGQYRMANGYNEVIWITSDICNDGDFIVPGYEDDYC